MAPFQFRKTGSSQQQQAKSSNRDENFSIRLGSSVQENVANLQKEMDNANDLITRFIQIGMQKQVGVVICIDGLIDKQLVNDLIIKNMQLLSLRREIPTDPKELLSFLQYEVVSVSESKQATTMDEISLAILSGDTVVMLDGLDVALVFGTKGWATRAIEEPISEALVRGPRDGFTESIRTNTMLIRRRIRDTNLRFDMYRVGRRSKQELMVTYIDGIIHPAILKEVKRRVESIDIDSLLESGYVEQLIEDSFLSPFPQCLATERPDKLSAALLQGKVGILLDGTPFALILPITFNQLLQSPEDYNERFIISSLIRLLRFLAAFIAVFLPALYIALLSYHPGMIPSQLAFQIAGAREGVPFPAFVEAFAMEATLELLREAGLRLPRPIGQTIGIVGGLVIGEAAVQAGIVSPIMVIVVALTAISSFALPAYSVGIAMRVLRFGCMIAAAMFGLYGIILVYIMINIHIANLKSFGVPYSTPFAPSIFSDWGDLIIRLPLVFLRKRPAMMQTGDKVRMGEGRKQE